MGSSVLSLIACTPILGGWIAVTVCHYRLTARRRRESAEWAWLAEGVSGLAEVDADLDRAWDDEQEWIRRYR
ncbi:MAG TPA: hypothetical protein VF838_07510 [Trebonia sp.]